jgi:hypothetical protein
MEREVIPVGKKKKKKVSFHLVGAAGAPLCNSPMRMITVQQDDKFLTRWLSS